MTDYLERARTTQRFTLERLGYVGGAVDCAAAPYLCYRRSDAESQWMDQWYLTSQIGADAALRRADPSFPAEYLVKAAAFLEFLYDADEGGYVARCSPDASQIMGPDKFCDDHGHLGLMLLDAYEATGDARFLKPARRAADFLIRGRVWDQTFGGGFWWYTGRGNTIEGKPAQANGLAVDLFGQLFGLTGEARYREWALRTLRWLDERLYDSEAGLYRWSRHYRDLGRKRGEVLARRFFNYDQGIIIEALLTLYRHVDPNPAYVERARALAERLGPAFWHRPEGGFNLESGVECVVAIYGSWLTPSLLALYEVDRDDRWLRLARRNVDAMDRYLRTPDGGYFKLAQLAEGDWAVDHTLDTAANAGMQRAFAALALADDAR